VTMTSLARYTDADLDLDLRWWAAANFLTVGQIYLQANPLLREPLRREHIKPRLLGHWGTSPGLSMIYALLNRVIREREGDWLYVTNLALDLRVIGLPPAVDSAWAAEVTRYTVSKIRARIPEIAGGDHRR